MIGFVISFCMFLEVVCAILLIVVILMQRSKSGGGLGAIGGGATEEVFGSNAGNILTKTTVILSIFFLLNTLSLAVLQGNALRGRGVSVVDSVEETDASLFQAGDDAKKGEQAPGATAPAAPGATTEPAAGGDAAPAPAEAPGKEGS